MSIGPSMPLRLEKPEGIDLAQAARYFGARGGADAATQALLEKCAVPLLAAATPRAVWLEADPDSLTAAGILAGRFLLPDAAVAHCGTVIRWGLYLLLFLVGLDMGRQGSLIRDIRAAGLRVVLVPLAVMAGTFAVTALVGLFLPLGPKDCVAAAAGFGWYSLAPTLLAVVSQVGIDPIHFGIIMTLALAIAFVTPPVALNLFVGSSMTGLSIDKIVKAFMPFLIGLIVAFFIVSFVPAISLGVLGDWSLTFG